MTTIEDQIKLEKQMVSYGIQRYHNIKTTAENAGRVHDTTYARNIIKEFVIPVSDELRAFCLSRKAGQAAKYKALLRCIDPDKAAFFGLRVVVNSFMHDETLHNIANSIGTLVEDEIKFSMFHKEHGEYYETILDDFKRKGTNNYRYMHRVLTNKANALEVKHNAWSVTDRISVGTKILDCILSSTDLIDKSTTYIKGKTVVSIIPSEETKKWIKDYNKWAEMLHPYKMPCVIKPDDWIDLHNGGYYTPQMRKRSPMVKTREAKHNKLFDGDISNILSVINTLQNTAWVVNKEVLDVLIQVFSKSLGIGLPASDPYIIPTSPVAGKAKTDFTEEENELFKSWKEEARAIHILERERVSKCFQVSRVIKLANDYKDMEKFWYVYQFDFRGRLYAQCTGFSPQGPDFGKAVLKFAQAVPLTERGLYWLRIHGANCFGIDKVSFDDRIKWVLDNEEPIIQTALNPIEYTELWADADKPWQFLAFCFEYARYKREGLGFLCNLPIGVDGTCNGLQNFSAMLRDPVGGQATNLLPSDKPADIYTEVANVCTKRVLQAPDGLSQWKELIHTQGSLSRKLVKRPVMTLPYGSTQNSCRAYIHEYLIENNIFSENDRFKASLELTPILWDSIGAVVIAARKAMRFIQECSSALTKEGCPLIWWTPIGFPVYQGSRKLEVTRVRTELAGCINLKVGCETDELDVRKNRLGSSPNFVHSMDACHLMLTVRKAIQNGITDFAMIHDDYGTHANNIDILNENIRDAFIELYKHNDPLLDFKVFNEDKSGITLPELPTKNSLNIDLVIDSKYFFH